MKKVLLAIFNSFNNSSEGFSARKLSAFIGVVTSILTTFYFGTPPYVAELVLIWLGFSLLTLGIITVQQIIDFRSGKSTTSTASSFSQTTSSSEETVK